MSTTTWYQGFVDTGVPGFLDVNDLRDFSVVTANYDGMYGSKAKLPAGSTVTCTAGGVGVGLCTKTIPVTAFSTGGRISSVMSVTAPLTIEDVARYGGTVTNIDANMADTGATYAKKSVWSNAGDAP